jgi:hypothetical protein
VVEEGSLTGGKLIKVKVVVNHEVARTLRKHKGEVICLIG